VLAVICLPRFFRYSASCCSWVLVVSRSKVGTACTKNTIPACYSLVVLHVLPVSVEICERRASILALMLDAGARGAVVTTILPFLLRRTPIGRASLLLHLVSSSVMISCNLGRVGVMSVWLLVLIIKSRSSLGYILARAGGAADASCCCEGSAATTACAKVSALPFPLLVTSTQSLAWCHGVTPSPSRGTCINKERP